MSNIYNLICNKICNILIYFFIILFYFHFFLYLNYVLYILYIISLYKHEMRFVQY